MFWAKIIRLSVKDVTTIYLIIVSYFTPRRVNRPRLKMRWFGPGGLLQCLLMGHSIHWTQNGLTVLAYLLSLPFLSHFIYDFPPSPSIFVFSKCRRQGKKQANPLVQLSPIIFRKVHQRLCGAVFFFAGTNCTFYPETSSGYANEQSYLYTLKGKSYSRWFLSYCIFFF